MVKTSKPESPTKKLRLDPSNGLPSNSPNKEASNTTSTTLAVDPAVAQLHRAWRQFVSSFLVAARSQPSSQIPDPNSLKLLNDTVDTNLKTRAEIRRVLSSIEEHLRGRTGKRRELLEEDKRSMSIAVISDNRKRNLYDVNDEEGTNNSLTAQEVIDVDAGDLDQFPII